MRVSQKEVFRENKILVFNVLIVLLIFVLSIFSLIPIGFDSTPIAGMQVVSTVISVASGKWSDPADWYVGGNVVFSSTRIPRSYILLEQMEWNLAQQL